MIKALQAFHSGNEGSLYSLFEEMLTNKSVVHSFPSDRGHDIFRLPIFWVNILTFHLQDNTKMSLVLT